MGRPKKTQPEPKKKFGSSIEDIYKDSEEFKEYDESDVVMDENGIRFNSQTGELVKSSKIYKYKYNGELLTEKQYRRAVKDVQLLFLSTFRENNYVAFKTCKQLGIAQNVFRNWIRQDAVFLRAFNYLMKEWEGYILDKQREHIDSGNYEALKMELKARIPDLYDRNMVEVNNTSGEIRVIFEENLHKNDAIEKLIKKYDASKDF